MTCFFTRRYKSPLGDMLLACDEKGLSGVWFEGQKHFAAGLENTEENADVVYLAEAALWLDEYFAGGCPDIGRIRLSLHGTEFQRRVWTGLCGINYGEILSYGGLAQRLGGTSPRAVGSAVGRNPVSVIVPCHRIVGADGSMTGYAGGIWRKKFLLALEREKMSAAIPHEGHRAYAQ